MSPSQENSYSAKPVLMPPKAPKLPAQDPLWDTFKPQQMRKEIDRKE